MPHSSAVLIPSFCGNGFGSGFHHGHPWFEQLRLLPIRPHRSEVVGVGIQLRDASSLAAHGTRSPIPPQIEPGSLPSLVGLGELSRPPQVVYGCMVLLELFKLSKKMGLSFNQKRCRTAAIAPFGRCASARSIFTPILRPLISARSGRAGRGRRRRNAGHAIDGFRVEGTIPELGGLLGPLS